MIGADGHGLRPAVRCSERLPLDFRARQASSGIAVTAKVSRISRGKARLSRSDWLAAARRVFVGTGIDEVKIDRLAKELGVTRGSFYWHFKDLDDLRSALVEDWREHNRREIEAIEKHWVDESPSLIDVGVAWFAERQGDMTVFSSAMRDWARKDNRIAPLVHEIDRSWIALIARAFAAMGYDADDSTVRARIVYYHRIGYHALPLDESLEELCALQSHFTRAFAGRELDHEEELELRQRLERPPSARRRSP